MKEPNRGPGEDIVPSLDMREPVATYRAWVPEDTMVKVYAINTAVFPGIPATSREAAAKHCTQNWGEILEANYVPHRAFFRVKRPKPGVGK